MGAKTCPLMMLVDDDLSNIRWLIEQVWEDLRNDRQADRDQVAMVAEKNEELLNNLVEEAFMLLYSS